MAGTFIGLVVPVAEEAPKPVTQAKKPATRRTTTTTNKEEK